MPSNKKQELIDSILRKQSFSNRRTKPTTLKPQPPDYETRVLGGNIVNPPGKYPWFCLIESAFGEKRCGATLIHPEYILTAAHCLDHGTPIDRNVHCDIHYHNDGMWGYYNNPHSGEYSADPVGEISSIDQVWLHDDYVANEFNTFMEILGLVWDWATNDLPGPDLAIAHINPPIDNIQPVKLISESYMENDSQPAIHIGHGGTSPEFEWFIPGPGQAGDNGGCCGGHVYAVDGSELEACFWLRNAWYDCGGQWCNCCDEVGYQGDPWWRYLPSGCWIPEAGAIPPQQVLFAGECIQHTGTYDYNNMPDWGMVGTWPAWEVCDITDNNYLHEVLLHVNHGCGWMPGSTLWDMGFTCIGTDNLPINGGGACSGDSGGPTIHTNSGEQLGIMSFSSPNCSGSAEHPLGWDWPFTVTRIWPFKDWIADIVGDCIYLNTCGCAAALGDLNNDGTWNVLDIVNLANCVLAQNCPDIDNGCAGDLNGDGAYNVLDIVTLANCVLAQNCGG